MTTLCSPEYSLSTTQGRYKMMDCPLTNQGPYTLTLRIGAKRGELKVSLAWVHDNAPLVLRVGVTWK